MQITISFKTKVMPSYKHQLRLNCYPSTMYELKRDKTANERFQYVSGNSRLEEQKHPGSKYLRIGTDENEVVKFKACHQLSKALQPKPPRSAPTMSSGRAFSQPPSPVMKRQSNFLPFRNHPLSCPDDSKVNHESWNIEANRRLPAFVERQINNSNDNNGYLTILKNDRYNSYTRGRVINESLCPLLREALRKDDDDFVLESILQKRNKKKIDDKTHRIQMTPNSIKSQLVIKQNDKGRSVTDQSCNERNGSLEFLISGVFFTVKIMKTERDCLGFTMGTSTFDGKKMIVIDQIVKGSEAMNFLEEGDELMSINGITSLNLSDILKYIKQLDQEIVCLDIHRRF